VALAVSVAQEDKVVYAVVQERLVLRAPQVMVDQLT
jgi:hypothetical protein